MSPEWGRYDQAKADIDIAVHAADIDAHMDDLMRLYRTGEYMLGTPFSSATGAALLADYIYASPFFVARAMTVDRIAIHVSTAGAAGKIARLGIYRDGTNCYPGALLLDAGTVAVDSTGIKAITISQALTKGWYWCVVVPDGAPSLRVYFPAILPFGPVATDFSDSYNIWRKAAVGAAALADPFVADAVQNSSAAPKVLLRLLSLD